MLRRILIDLMIAEIEKLPDNVILLPSYVDKLVEDLEPQVRCLRLRVHPSHGPVVGRMIADMPISSVFLVDCDASPCGHGPVASGADARYARRVNAWNCTKLRTVPMAR